MMNEVTSDPSITPFPKIMLVSINKLAEPISYKGASRREVNKLKLLYSIFYLIGENSTYFFNHCIL